MALQELFELLLGARSTSALFDNCFLPNRNQVHGVNVQLKTIISDARKIAMASENDQNCIEHRGS